MSEQFDSNMEEVVAPAALPLPGSILRATREAHGYSLAEIAQVLKFGVRQLEALENDDYSSLKGTTFIRGFVRSYARYLKLDETPLLAALEPQAPVAVAEVRAVESMEARMPVGNADGSKRAYGFAVAVLLLGVVAWFVWQEQSAPDSPAAPASQLAAPAPTTLAPEEVVAPAALVPTSAKPEETAPAASAVMPSSSSLAPVPGIVESASVATDAAVSNPNEKQMQLAFSGVSWVEVRDASNRIVYSGNSTPDSRQTVRGRPPFQLVIGNAQSVKLRYEDRSIDLQPYTRVDVARLTLDDNTK